MSPVKVAAYQAPLLGDGSVEALGLIRTRVKWCEAEGVTILCCPEAVLGGLADYSADPRRSAVAADGGQLDAVLAPLASETVTTIVGFTELGDRDRLYNSAAVFHRGAVAGIYRKLHPAINRSVYDAGSETPIFHIEGLTFGIVICNDSNFPAPAKRMAALGATALFIPTNAGLPPARPHAKVVAAARAVDVSLAIENSLWIVRADVSGRTEQLVSLGSSEIVNPRGAVVRAARELSEDLLVVEIGAGVSN